MALFRKIDPRIWNDEKFRSLSDDARLTFLFVLTHPNLTALGAMRATVPGLAAEIGWKPRRLRAALVALSERGMIEIDEAASFVCAPNFLRYNEPTGPNSVIKAWPNALNLIPECGGKTALVARCRQYLVQKSKEFRDFIGDTIWDVFRDVPGDGPGQPSPIQELEQELENESEQKQERERDIEQPRHKGDGQAPPVAAPLSPSGGNEKPSSENPEPETPAATSPVTAATPQQLLDAWNRCAPNLVPAHTLTLSRTRLAQDRLRERPALAEWEGIFRRMNASPFLRGQNDWKWRASFDWALKPDSVLHVLEGKYDVPPVAPESPLIAAARARNAARGIR